MSLDTLPRTAGSGRRRSGWLVLGAVFTVAVLLAAIGFLGLRMAGFASVKTEQQRQNYDHAVTGVVLDVDSGDVTLAAGDAGQVSVERQVKWSKAKPTVDEQWSGDTLRVTSRCPDGDGWFGICCLTASEDHRVFGVAGLVGLDHILAQ